jgi:S-disulfanyl-L-cysteine oxidoreductase SoxD
MSSPKMSSPKAFLIAALGVILLSPFSGVAAEDTIPSPHLGAKVSEADLAFWDRSVQPDGRALPKGSGTVKAGAAIFAERCAACHGEDGTKSPVGLPALVGGKGTLASDHPVMTVGSFWPYATTVFDYIRRAMPYDAPKSLSDSEVYAVTAYLLNLNGLIGEGDVMDEASLPKVRMPNRDGFASRELELK